MQIFEYGIYLAWCFTCSIGLPIWPPGTRKCNRYPSSIDTFKFCCPLLFVAGLPGHHWCTRYIIVFLPDMHNLRTVDILVSACLYQKTNLQSKHTPGRAAVLAVLRESRTMPIKELCRWPNFIICCHPIDSLDYMYPSSDKETRIESEKHKWKRWREAALIQRIPWSRGSTYRCIFHQYTECVKHKYRDAIVVFDGYDCTHT